MAKTKHDFVQLTKSYCKQNKTFLGNTTVTDYLGGDLPPGHRPLCGGGRWRMENGAAGCARGGGLVESSPGFLLDQPNQRDDGETEREQNTPLANRQALRKQAIPPANR